MSAQEPLSILGAVFGVMVQLGFAVGLFAWAHRVAKARGGHFRLAQYLPFVGLVATLLGICVTSALLVSAFGHTAAIPAEHRAAQLAADISSAMTATACGLVLTVACYLSSAVISALGTWGRGAKSAQDETSSG